MIHRIFILLLLLIIIPDAYIYLRWMRRRCTALWQRIALWLPCAAMCAYTLMLASVKSFAPERMEVLSLYLFLLGLLFIPKFVFSVCSACGWGISRLLHRKGKGKRHNYGNLLGLILALCVVYIIIYGCTKGFSTIVVKHIDYTDAAIPEAFDGYRIVHFSDAHVGTYTGSSTQTLARAMDSIMAAKADLIVFTGDIQNMRPKEVQPVKSYLERLKARDGVLSILGNHDYAQYVDVDSDEARRLEREIVEVERALGWDLLLNEKRVVRRGGDSIVVAGMENDGRYPFPSRINMETTLQNVGDSAFVIMLQHDPTSWRRTILPQSTAQLTLSGHTHAGQFVIFGWSPVALMYDEWGGMYTDSGTGRSLFVSTGLGGFVPFRFGVPGEIVVFTLHSGAK